MRRCIGCKPKDWMKFNFGSYKQHQRGKGYASPKVCLSAGYQWARIVKAEFTVHAQRRMDECNNRRWEYLAGVPPCPSAKDTNTYEIPKGWDGAGVCIVMHDGSSCVLGVMLQLYLPSADTRLYNKNYSVKEKDPPQDNHLIVMCEDGISAGNSLYKMRVACERPIDLFMTIGGNKLRNIHEYVSDRFDMPITDLVKLHHQLDMGRVVWDAKDWKGE